MHLLERYLTNDFGRCYACHTAVSPDPYDELPTRRVTDTGEDRDFLLCDSCADALGFPVVGPITGPVELNTAVCLSIP